MIFIELYSLCFVELGISFLLIYFSPSVEHSGGQRVRLDLEKLDQFSLFPGQVKICALV